MSFIEDIIPLLAEPNQCIHIKKPPVAKLLVSGLPEGNAVILL